MNKRGEILIRNVVFIVLNVLFFAAMFVFVARAGSNVTFYEQVHAKQIALLIDSAKPGTEITANKFKLYDLAEKQEFGENIVVIDNNEKKVTVRVRKGKGYSFNYFSDLKITYESPNRQKGISDLFLKFEKV